MTNLRIALAAIAAIALLPPGAACKDFPEPVLSVDPLAAATRPGLPAGMGGAFEYCNYAFAHDEVDSFYFRVSASPAFVDLGDAFALGSIFESTLMCGPLRTGTTAANVAAFWMNAVQFEYGLYASLAVTEPGKDGFHLLAEYSRTSQHPLGSPGLTYSQVSSDILAVGLAPPELALGPATVLSYLRIGYCSLLAFWGSSLAQPRASWFLKPAVEVELPLEGLALVARAYPYIFIDRYAKRLDADWFAEAGAILARGRESAELLVTLYDTRNSEMLDEAVHPTFEAGVSVRFSYDRARLPGPG